MKGRKMKFFCFYQNNAGGVFRDPAAVIIIKAEDSFSANREALDLGVYLDGVKLGLDCECCGNRWELVRDSDGFSYISDLKSSLANETKQLAKVVKKCDVPLFVYRDSESLETVYISSLEDMLLFLDSKQ